MKKIAKKHNLKTISKFSKNNQFLADWGYSIVPNYENIEDYISENELLDEEYMSKFIYDNIK